METAATTDSSFKQQFRQHENLELPEGKISIVDIKPETLNDQTAVLIAPGWSENYDTYKKTLGVAFDSGRRGIAVDYSRRGGEIISDPEYPEAELRKAQLILGVLDKKAIEKADVIAHSEGAIYILIAAMIKPDQFRNIVLDKPAGLIGKDTKSALMGRFMRLLVQEAMLRPKLFTDPTSSVRTGTRTALYIAENPGRVIKEMEVITSFEITDLMKALHGRGVMFSIVAGVDDPLFPVKRQIEHMRESGVPPIKGYYSVVGGHNELSIHADKHAALAVDALNGLQRVRSSRLDP